MKSSRKSICLILALVSIVSCRTEPDALHDYEYIMRIVNDTDATVTLANIKSGVFPYPDNIRLSPGDEWCDSIVRPDSYFTSNITPKSLVIMLDDASMTQNREYPRNGICFIRLYRCISSGYSYDCTFTITDELLSAWFEAAQ